VQKETRRTIECRGVEPPQWWVLLGVGLRYSAFGLKEFLHLEVVLRFFHAGVSALVRWCTVMMLAAWLAGCASSPHPAAPAVVEGGSSDYIIGPGDALSITVWRNPELSMSVPVRPDGKISAPLVEELVAQGKTSAQLARDIEGALGKYVRDPVVTVIVTGFVGPYSQQIRVVGEAARPQALPFKQKMSVLDVMIAVGGLTDFADGNRATLVRAAEGNKRYAVRLHDLIKRGDISANVEMQPGDVLIIPQGLF
jgi:polysaccharide biosynthesis/export protein